MTFSLPGRLVDRCRHLRFAAARRQPGGAIGNGAESASRGNRRKEPCGLMTEQAPAPARPLASLGGLELAIPECAKGIGAVIGAARFGGPDRGRGIQPLAVYPDDRGYFLEVQRIGRGPGGATSRPKPRQVSAALSYAGTIKAFHYHLHQTDCWTPAKGHVASGAGGSARRLAHLRRAQHHVRGPAAALADPDPARRGARI